MDTSSASRRSSRPTELRREKVPCAALNVLGVVGPELRRLPRVIEAAAGLRIDLDIDGAPERAQALLERLDRPDRSTGVAAAEATQHRGVHGAEILRVLGQSCLLDRH